MTRSLIDPSVSQDGLKSVLIIIDYFGQWPEWFPIFMASCETNPTVNWLFHTDCPVPRRCPSNVAFSHIEFGDYCARVSDVLGINFRPGGSYRICDVRPAFGLLYEDEVRPFDYFGYGDIDVIYGNIRKIYDATVLSHDFISAHLGIGSGHLTLFRNEKRLREAFREIPRWKRIMETPGPIEWRDCLDEAGLGELFARRPKTYFREQYTTPLKPEPWIAGSPEHPSAWFWNNGRLTNDRDGDREFIYLHFMNYVSARYMDAKHGDKPPWSVLDRVVRFDPEAWDTKNEVLIIDTAGFSLKAAPRDLCRYGGW